MDTTGPADQDRTGRCRRAHAHIDARRCRTTSAATQDTQESYKTLLPVSRTAVRVALAGAGVVPRRKKHGVLPRLPSGAGRQAYDKRDEPDTISSRRGCGLFTDLPFNIPYPNAIMVCALAPIVRGGAPRVQRA